MEDKINAILFAAGNGMRLRPITDDIQKCLLHINGKPMLEWWLDAVFASESFDKVYVNIHYLAKSVMDWIEMYSIQKSRKILIIDERYKLLGTARTIFHNADRTQDFMSVYTDTYSEVIFRRLPIYVDKFQRDTVDMIAGVIIFDRPDEKSTGNIIFDKDLIMTEFSEKEGAPGAAWTGVLFGRPELFNFIENSDKDLAYDVIPRLVGRTRVLGHVEACDIGRGVEYYEQFKRTFGKQSV